MGSPVGRIHNKTGALLHLATFMTAELLYLRRLCRPDQGTSIEIVSAAWHLAIEKGLSAAQVLALLEPATTSAVIAAADHCAQNLQPDGLGFAILGTTQPSAESSRYFVPRDFVMQLSRRANDGPPQQEDNHP